MQPQLSLTFPGQCGFKVTNSFLKMVPATLTLKQRQPLVLISMNYLTGLEKAKKLFLGEESRQPDSCENMRHVGGGSFQTVAVVDLL